MRFPNNPMFISRIVLLDHICDNNMQWNFNKIQIENWTSLDLVTIIEIICILIP